MESHNEISEANIEAVSVPGNVSKQKHICDATRFLGFPGQRIKIEPSDFPSTHNNILID